MMYGLGIVAAAPGNPACTGPSSWFDPYCWLFGPPDTSSNYVGVPAPPPPMPPPAPVPTANNPNPLTTPPATGADAQATVDATIAAGVAANQAMYQNWFASVPSDCTQTILPSAGICDTTVYIGVGVAVLLGFVFMAGGRRR